jgi:hypothetical protein
MKKISNSGYRFPPEISFRDVEDLLAERGRTNSAHWPQRIAAIWMEGRSKRHPT